MITGLTLPDFAAKIVADARAKRDFKASTARLVASSAGTIALATASDVFALTPTQYALRQIGEHTGIPAKYVDRMASEAPGLLASNLNHWFAANPTTRLVRTHINGTQTMRAFLSDKYRPMDNDDLAAHILPILQQAGWVIKSADITDTKLYIQAISEALAAEIKERNKTDILHPGVVISNSEVGAGRLKIESLVYKLSCTNGMIHGAQIKRNHVGRAFDGGFGDSEGAQEYFSDETRRLDDQALWSKVSDVLRGSVDEAKFHALVRQCQALTDVALPGTIQEAVEVTARAHGFNATEAESILQHFITDGDLSAWGLINAVTRTAQDATSYDRAVEIETIGGAMFAEYSRN